MEAAFELLSGYQCPDGFRDMARRGDKSMVCVDLQGIWNLFLDEKKRCEKPPVGIDTIYLPDSTAHAGKGNEKSKPSVSYMTDRFYFEGYAWYSRQIMIRPEWEDKRIVLFLERTRISTVYVDGEELGTKNSLCGFHEHDLTGKLAAGSHILTIRVDNTDYPTKGGHMTSPDTQTNWNGILGRMELQIRDTVYPTNLQVSAAIPEEVKVTADICGKDNGVAQIAIFRKSGECLYQGKQTFYGSALTAVIFLTGENLLWDEYHTNLLTIKVTVGTESVSTDFGIRKLSHEGRKLLVNEKQVFWRGKHDGLVFPETGYAPMTVEAWKKVFRTAKQYGMNHYRFHTCCPPEAAFAAADEVGIYLEPELPFWGTIAAPGEEQYREEEQAYLVEEGFRILKEFGNHPSFVMLSMGNELWGNTERINCFLQAYKKVDDRHFYTQGSNNFQFCPVVLPDEDVFCGVRLAGDRLFRGSYAMCDAPQGHIQTQIPNTTHHYDEILVPKRLDRMVTGDDEIEIQYGTGTKKVKAIDSAGGLIPQVPVVSHEIGQYDFFPDFDELGRYEGPLQPLYLEIYRKRMEETGIYSQWRDFFKATGKLAVDCYKRELEAAFRSRELSGFQLLDLQDFPGQSVALVGVLNAWMESKGLIEAKEWRNFCNDVVILGEISSFVVKEKETIQIPVKLSVCNREVFSKESLQYHIMDGGKILAEGVWDIAPIAERVIDIGVITFEVPELRCARKLEIKLWIKGTDYENRYSLWAYPEESITITEEGLVYQGQELQIVKSMEQALTLQKEGRKVLCIPDSEPGDVEGTYCTDFWNYPMFRSISESMGRRVPIGTLGLLIHENEVLKKGFACENYSTPQWYQLVTNSHCKVLDTKEDIELLVQPIDNVERCHKLGMLYYEKGILVCTSKLYKIKEYPEVRTFAKILFDLCR